ncbi:MAG TPA: ATP-NAD kinase family protein [Thermoleophilia bacterium]|nr:ATP-NAD kinase family protein [Thermoleophilia bacterium]
MSDSRPKRLGLIVNPVAGVGGRVGLKGSDGLDILRRALALGAVRDAPRRVGLALARLARLCEHIEIVTCPGEMGADEARAAGFEPVVLEGVAGAGSDERRELLPDGVPVTTSADTEAAARALRDLGVDLLLFAGGDGTARDICHAVDGDLPVLGVPAGVKIHSAVYATTPARAGDLAALYLHDRPAAVRLRESEVMDIDEDAFRDDRVSARLYGYLQVPYERSMVQSAKAGGVAGDAADLRAIAQDVVNEMDPGVVYLLGPGTTMRSVAEALGVTKTLLGVDAVRDHALLANDLNERQILDLIGGGPARIVVTVIGGQGYIFGRGNQQLSADVIRRVGGDGVVVVATQTKLLSLRGGPLLVDTGDPALDEQLSGYHQVVTNLGHRTMYRVAGATGDEPAPAPSAS